MEFGELFRLRDWRLYHDGDGMATVQCFCREQFPHLFTTRPRVIANGRNYPDSHSISYSFAGLGKLLRIRRAGTPAQISAPGITDGSLPASAAHQTVHSRSMTVPVPNFSHGFTSARPVSSIDL